MARRVLIADDEPLLKHTLSELLTQRGFEVQCAKDGVEAMELVRRGRPDLIVLDVMMPELNGFQACKRIRSEPQLGETPIVLLSARDEEADRFWGEEVGATRFVAKSTGTDEIVALIEELVS